MSKGLISDHFRGVVFKTLSAVEADVLKSNQHEYNGTNALRRILGDARKTFPARFLYLDDEGEKLGDDGFLTWYDARERHPTRSEYRLYFPSNVVTSRTRAGDALFIAIRPDGDALVVIAPAASTVRTQLLWLFGVDGDAGDTFESRDFAHEPSRTGFVARLILDELGVEAEGPGEEQFDALVEPFGLTFPPTREFSDFARSTLPGIDCRDDPDGVILAWIEREEQLFRRLERRVVAERLTTGFAANGIVDVDGFLSFSLSVQNRRKSRAGAALENHLEVLFKALELDFERGAETENRNRPDFLFPGSAAYQNPGFPTDGLLMLGSKTTCKDRWRQVLSEARRIHHKHLFTLEPGISETQTEEMEAKLLHLVLPSELHDTYRPSQRGALMTLRAFTELAEETQAKRRA